MKGMSVAVARLSVAIREDETIGIFGDYDADGVPATALLVRALRGLGVEPVALIPTRAAGYGLNPGAVAEIISQGITLLITVDNGTVSESEIAALKEAGIDTIVCDHHEPQEGHLAYSALAILNPKQPDCPYPFKELCGCAIAWKLMISLYGELGRDWTPLKWELDLVAFSTIADMVPMLGENRVLVTYGLQVLRKTRNVGLKALAEVAGIELSKLSSGSVGFQLAPRINAPSRMHQEMEGGRNVALSLLTEPDSTEARRLAGYLNDQNAGRQRLLEQHLKEAEALAVAQGDDLCLVLYGETWSTGVIGLVAGRMLERFGRPVVALATEGGAIKGSVRSLDGFHAVELMAGAGELLERYGGHSKAGGLSLGEGVLPDQLRDSLNIWAAGQGWNHAGFAVAWRRGADLEISLQDADMELAEGLAVLEPFGIGFSAPLFESECKLGSVRRVGREQKHLACFLEDGAVRRKAIAFGKGETEVDPEQQYLVMYALEVEEWNNVRAPSCLIRRIEPSA